ncbi:unnamed protein product [Sphagnum tenellum]
MMFMNQWEIDEAVVRHPASTVQGQAARILQRLRDQVNEISDGWAYWSKPLQASKNLMILVQYRGGAVSEADLKKALIPVKSFCTKHGLDSAKIFQL